MNKKLLLSAFLIWLIGMSVTSVAQQELLQGRKDRSIARQERKKLVRQVAPTMQRIMGGTNNDKPLYGLLVDSYDGVILKWSGPIQVSAKGAHRKLATNGFGERAFAGCYFDGKYFVLQHNSLNPKIVRYEFYNGKTWEYESGGDYTLNSPHILGSGLTYDPSSKLIYGMFYEETENYIGSTDAQLGYVNVENIFNPVTIVGEMGVRMRAMAADEQGTLYGVSYDGTIYKIDKKTAAITQVSKIKWPAFGGDFDPENPFSYYGNDAAVIDYETGAMYLSFADGKDDSFIIKVDLATGASEVKANYSYWSGGNGSVDIITGIYFEQESSVQVAGIPEAPWIVDYKAVGADLKASVSFTMPKVDIEGDTLTTDIGWIIGDGISAEYASGKAKPGADVLGAEVPVQKAGMTTLVLQAVNGEAKSKGVKFELYIGPDTPVIEKKPMLVVNGENVTVRWEAPKGLNGGNLATPQTYKLVRMPDNVVVTEAATGTTYTDVVKSEKKTLYHYLITPKAGEMVGEAVESRSAYVGNHFEMPHSDSFDNELLFNEYPVIDNNKDDNTWWINAAQGAAVFSGNDRDADDYLLVGPFKMKEKSKYNFVMLAGGHSVAEHVAVYVGNNSDDVTSFSELIPKTMLNPSTTGDLRLSASYAAPADGEYYFAIKACSKAYTQNLYVYDVNISEVSSKAPAAPQVKATPKAASALFNITLPSTSIDESAAANVTLLRIYRDDRFVIELSENIKDEAEITWEDKDPVADGTHGYKFVAVNASGEGDSYEIDLYRGLDIPNTPSNLRVVEDLATPGLMHITWDAPELGYRGGYVNPEDITYVIDYMTDNGESKTIENITATKYDLQLGKQVKQGFVSASVYGVNGAGYDRMSWNTRTAYYGPALNLPMRESWNEMSQKSGLWIGEAIVDVQGLFESYWDIINGEISGKKPQDGDGGMMGCSTTTDNGGYRIRTPRLSLTDIDNPTLIFYYLYTTDIKEYRLEVLVDDQPIRTMKDLDIDPANAGKWIRQEISLAEIKDCKYVQFAFTAVSKVAAVEFACFDNVSVTDNVGDDLQVVEFSGATKADVNKEITFDLTIRNNGSDKVAGSDYTVKFYKNNVLVEEATGVEIASDAMATMHLKDMVLVTDPVSTEYYAEVIYEKDKLADNNRSATQLVRVIAPIYPRVTDLSAKNNGGVELTWSDPSASDMPSTPVTESFENYQKFSISNIGDWGLHDGDKAPTVVLVDVTGELTYPHISEPMSWMVFDPLEANVTAAAWSPRTGDNMLVSFQACKEGTRNENSEDWLISPELFGKAQTISFYGRAGMKQYAETIDIMYSTTGNAVSDFKTLELDVDVPYSKEEWTEFFFDLPEGTRYFAIVHKTFGGIAVLIDDITYIASGSTPEKVQLQGYNVYRDGVKLNNELIGDTQFVDETAEEGKEYTYYVTAVWDKGESGLSNAATIIASSGIGCIDTAELDIYASRGAICIDGGTGQRVAVFTTTGTCVGMAVVDGDIEIPVPAAGIYIVKTENSVKKLVVK